MSESGPSSTKYTEAWLAGFDGHQFYTRTYAASTPKAVVLFVHGFAEHVGRYEHFHVNYPKRDITLFSYDLRGFGRTALDAQHRSKDSAYGKTNWKWQMSDIEHWAKYLVKTYPNVPLFLMGHSMGGALTLGYATRSSPPPSPESVKLFTGFIISSPLIVLTTPQPKFLRWTGGKLANLAPYMSFPADVKAEDLSRDPAANDANLNDPLIKRQGTLRGLDDMLSGGERLLENDWRLWPKSMPVLFVHGTDDKVTSHKATQSFYDKMVADDKKISLYEGGYHELVHEIDGIPEKLFEEITSWVEAHLPAAEPKL